MAGFNLFAKLQNFDDANYSFGESNIDVEDDVIVELEQTLTPKVAVKPKKGRGKKGKAKSSQEESCADLCTSDNEAPAAVVPGVGQKTAFKKLSKLKESLATTTVADSKRLRSRSVMNAAIRDDYEARRTKRRSRLRNVEEEVHHVASPLVHSNNIIESFDDDELCISIKIKWEGTTKVEKIDYSTYKTFKELIDQLGTREKIDGKSILLMFGNDVIKPDHSPHSIGYTLGKFISVRVVDNPHVYQSGSTLAAQSNTIEVKIQSAQWKKPMVCNIKLTDQFKVLIGMCSEKLKCHPNKIRFKFDGEILSTTSTPEDFDFDGGEIIDLLISA